MVRFSVSNETLNLTFKNIENTIAKIESHLDINLNAEQKRIRVIPVFLP